MRYIILFIILLNTGVLLMGSGKKPNNLNREDKKIMNKIQKKYDIDIYTFKKSPSSFKTLRIYSAMFAGWQGADPPGPPDTYFVTPKNRVFTVITDALTDVKYIPKDEKDALDIALTITGFDTPPCTHTILNESDISEADRYCYGKLIPNDIFTKLNVSTPVVEKDNKTYIITVYSYISKKTASRFEVGARKIFKSKVTINNFFYESDIENLWEVIDK